MKVSCSKCGKEIEDSNAFCPYCGTPNTMTGAQAPTSMDPKTQLADDDDDATVPAIGLDDSMQQSAPRPVQQPQPQPQQYGPQYGHPQYGQPQYGPQYAPYGQQYQTRRTNNKALIAAILVGAVLLVLVFILLYKVYGGSDATAPVQPAAQDTVAAATATAATPAPAAAPAQAPEAVAAPPAPAPDYSPKVISKKFSGSIGKIGITMNLTINPFTGAVSGTYYYNKYGPKNKLEVYGTVKGNYVEFFESNPQGEITGTFSGTLNNNPSVTSNVTSISGQMVNYKGESRNFNVRSAN